MKSHDAKTLAWLAPLGVLSLVWWLFRATPCLDYHLANQWRQWFPSPPAVVPPADDPAAQIISNPYGIVTCDFWPEASDHVISVALWLLITGAIGFLAARNLEQRAARRAALIAGTGLGLAFCISHLAFLPGLIRDADVLGGWEPAAIEIGLSVVFTMVGASLSALAAWLTVRHRARITRK